MAISSKELSARFAELSPEKRALLMQKLKKANGNARSCATIAPRTSTVSLPLSFSQERLWFLELLDPGSPAYNMPIALRIAGPLAPVLPDVLYEIQQRHEILRTTFKRLDAGPVQVVADVAGSVLATIDLSALSEADKKLETRRYAVEEAQSPFDIEKGPLFRATLLRLTEEEHVLLLTMHHIVSDGWSMDILIREVASLYKAFSSGAPSPLAKLPVHYGDFAIWQRDWLKDDTLEKLLQYWRRELAEAPPVLSLPTDHPRPAVQTFRGDYVVVRIDRKLELALKQLSRQWGGTLFMTLLAAFKVLLSKYTGVDKIVVGIPSANRNRAEIEGLIGLFVNALVLCTDTSGDPTFLSFFERVREVTVGAYEHQDLPFEKLVEELQPQRDLSHSPLFQVMFMLQTTAESLVLPDLNLSLLDVHSGTAKFDLTLGLLDAEDGITGAFEYNTDLFERATVERMVTHFQMLLKAAVAQPEQRLSALSLLTDREKQEIFLRWNDTGNGYQQDTCFPSMFEAQVARTPESVAVVCDGRSLTYQELNVRANRLARHLQKLGVGPEVLVGICVERSTELLLTLLAIMKAGGAYVPLDPSYPERRLQFMLKDAQVGILLTNETFLAKLPKYDATIFCIDRDWQSVREESCENLSCNFRDANLAYVIYTSGSTGNPKGVAVTHKDLANFLSGMMISPGIEPETVFAAVTTTSFDIAGLELYLPLLAGAKVAIVGHETASDGRLLSAFLSDSGADMMQATPATWQLLVQSGWRGNKKLKILVGGERLSADLAAELLQRCDSLWNMYGPTETTIWSSVWQVQPNCKTILIGRPISNTQMFILDKHLYPMPVGVFGELFIAGNGLARGYLNQPEMTALKFIPNPFSSDPGSRLYCTGDLVRYQPDGNIEFSGRIDHQVKVRGFRIELGEIESVLLEHPGVTAAVAVVREDAKNDQRLVAYVVAKKQKTLAVDELRHFLQGTLPAYMIPSAFVFMQEIPLMPNGKTDRNSLPSPECGRPELEGSYVPPTNEMERVITDIWQDVLHVDKVGINDNFFDLGGHSLLLVQVQNKINALLKKELSIIDLFKYPSVHALTTYLTHGREEIVDFVKLQNLVTKQKDALDRQRRLMHGLKESNRQA